MLRNQFNGGELGPPLHYRYDLERYYSGCKTLENFEVLPYGPVSRRPPLVPAGQVLETMREPEDPFRLLPFRYSEDTYYVLILGPVYQTEDIYLLVYDAAGDWVQTVLTPFADGDLYEISYCQVNDILFVAHQDHPLQRIERHGPADWRITEHAFRGGPWMPGNLERSLLMTPQLPRWDAATTYDEGDMVVVDGNEVTITSIDPVYWYRQQAGPDGPSTSYYLTQFTVGSHSWEVGETVYVTGTDFHDGQYTIEEVTDTAVRVDQGVFRPDGVGEYLNFTADTPAPSAVMGTRMTAFYEATETNTGVDPSADPTPAEWKARPVYYGDLALTATEDVFTAEMVGGRVRLDMDHDLSLTGEFSALASEIPNVVPTSDALPAHGAVRLATNGRWGGKLLLEESLDYGTTWTRLGAIESHQGSRNAEIERDVTPGAIVRVRIKDLHAPDPASSQTADDACKYTLTVQAPRVPCSLLVTEYTDARTVTVRTEDYLPASGPTWRWALGAFSCHMGFPSCVAIHEERLIVAGTKKRPQTVWGSQVNAWEKWYPGTLATSPITYTIAADSVNDIRWIVPHRDLLIGTDAAEWVMGSRERDKTLSGETVHVERHSQYGSAAVQAVPTADAVMFLQRGGKTVRAQRYAYETDGYVADDLCYLAPHVLGDGVAHLAFQRVPHSRLWVVRTDGQCSVVTYDPAQKVTGWYRVTTPGGTVASVAVTPGAQGEDVWALVRRHGTLYLERFDEAAGIGEYLDWRQEHTGIQILEAPVMEDWSQWNDRAVYADGRRVSSFWTGKRAITFDSPVTDPVLHYLAFLGENSLVVAQDGTVLSHIENTGALTIAVPGTHSELTIYGPGARGALNDITDAEGSVEYTDVYTRVVRVPSPADRIVLGLQYESRMILTDDVPGGPEGVPGRRKQVRDARIRVRDSYGAEFGMPAHPAGEYDWRALQFPVGPDTVDLFTGTLRVRGAGDMLDDVAPGVRAQGAHPLTVDLIDVDVEEVQDV